MKLQDWEASTLLELMSVAHRAALKLTTEVSPCNEIDALIGKTEDYSDMIVVLKFILGPTELPFPSPELLAVPASWTCRSTWGEE